MKIRLMLRGIREKVLELGDLRSGLGGVEDPRQAELVLGVSWSLLFVDTYPPKIGIGFPPDVMSVLSTILCLSLLYSFIAPSLLLKSAC
jgi:hypothetical protein